jgi:nucleoside 2-deoxyribosyltransferase
MNNSSFLVYLAGPITGLTFDDAADWRARASADLGAYGIKCLSPLRAKEILRAVGRLSGTGEEYAHLGVLSLPRGVTTRDRYDATRCDALLVNLLGAERVSIGTVMEIAWADLCRIPVVVAIEDRGNPHEHMMIAECIGFRVPSLQEAVNVVAAIAGNDLVASGAAQ